MKEEIDGEICVKKERKIETEGEDSSETKVKRN